MIKESQKGLQDLYLLDGPARRWHDSMSRGVPERHRPRPRMQAMAAER